MHNFLLLILCFFFFSLSGKGLDLFYLEIDCKVFTAVDSTLLDNVSVELWHNDSLIQIQKTPKNGHVKFEKIEGSREYDLYIKKEGFYVKWAKIDLRSKVQPAAIIFIQKIEVYLFENKQNNELVEQDSLPNAFFYFDSSGDFIFYRTSKEKTSNTNSDISSGYGCNFNLTPTYVLVTPLKEEDKIIYNALIDSAFQAVDQRKWFMATDYLERALLYNDSDAIKKDLVQFYSYARIEYSQKLRQL